MPAIHELRQQFLDYLQAETLQNEPTKLYEPVNYIMGLGGKRIRPLLCLIAQQMFADDSKSALPIALAVEIFHNFTLVHDDIMDEAALRRGKPTVHTKYDVNTAILSGDVMLIVAYQYLSRCPAVYLPNLLSIFSQTAREVCEGQQYDMNFETATDTEVQEYLKMIELKTAVLLAASLKMGAIVGGATAEQADDLYQFGRNIGLAFQLQDDLLDTFGNSEQTGKRVGGDIVRNKRTFLLIKALQTADEQQLAALNQWIATTDEHKETEKIAAVKAIFQQLKVKEAAQAKMDEYYERAFAFLAKTGVNAERQQPLIDITNLLMQRQH